MSEPEPIITDRWILQQRPPKNAVDPTRPYAFLVEKERLFDGSVDDVLTILLTNKECPFRCLMCDLWKNTTNEPVPRGAIPAQIRWALERVAPARHVKLYNAGSFFDRQAIAVEEYPEIARLAAPFKTVIVESHPRMIGRRCMRFNEMVGGKLQVAMGLETVHPGVLPRLNKQMTLEQFADAARVLGASRIPVRAFILLRPPFLSEAEGVFWTKRSIDFAFDSGVECCVIIPVRGGNGALDILAADGLFQSPLLDSLEEVLEYGIGQRRGRVFADLWDVERLMRDAADASTAQTRIERLVRMNHAQSVEPLLNAQSR
jgi:radical SAM enzyme (TIGR01210 family)